MRNDAVVRGLMPGVFTILLWSALPLLRSLAQLPPMQVAAIALTTAAVLSTAATRLWAR